MGRRHDLSRWRAPETLWLPTSRPIRVTIVAATANDSAHPIAAATCTVRQGVVSCQDMTTESDVEKLSRIMLDEFKRVHDRFDAMETQFSNLASEVATIHRRLDSLEETVGNVAGFAKEIDHLLKRVGAIEKHLGLNNRINA